LQEAWKGASGIADAAEQNARKQALQLEVRAMSMKQKKMREEFYKRYVRPIESQTCLYIYALEMHCSK
jgi:hypothetical protein